MKKKSIITAVMLLAVVAAAFIVRVLYISYFMDKVNVDEQLLNMALIKKDGNGIKSVFLSGFSLRTVYAFLLSFFCMVFGNFAVAGVYLNIALHITATLLLFCAGFNFFNRYVGLAVGTIYAFFPFFVKYVSNVNEINIIILLIITLVWFMSVLVWSAKKIYERKNAGKLLMEEKVTMEEASKDVQEESDGVTPQVSVPDSSMKEIILDEAEIQKPKYIENPLPVPKRRVHKEMDYVIETDARDDYDITDMTGKDFFDIE